MKNSIRLTTKGFTAKNAKKRQGEAFKPYLVRLGTGSGAVALSLERKLQVLRPEYGCAADNERGA